MGRADDIAWIDGAMVFPMLIQNTLCQLSNVRCAAVVRDREANLWVAAVVAWPDSSVDTVQCRKAIADQHGVLPILVVPLDRVPLTEQGKPGREAICQLTKPLENEIVDV